MRTLSIVDGLRQYEPALADELYAQALLRVKRTNTASRENIGLLANYIFPGFGEGVLRTSTPHRPGPPEGNAVSPALRDQFLDLALGAVTQWIDVNEQAAGAPTPRTTSNRTGDLVVGRLLLPYFNEHLPQKSAGVRARLEAARGAESEILKNSEGSVEGLLSKAEKAANASERDRVYWQAFMRALRDRNIDQASAILQKISDERMRAQLASALRGSKGQGLQGQAQAALDASDFDTAYRLINEIPERSQRISMLGNMAVLLSYKKDTAQALQVLSVQEQLITKTEDPTERAQEMIRFADIAARIDIERGFDATRLAVEALNRSSIGPHWVKMENVIDASGRTSSRRHAGLQLLASFLFDNTFSQLASSDFDRAMRLAQAVDLKEASALAQLGVCRGALK